ncbi:hypothetical protein P154DRAFT_575204 [Amniculicola lignicola CBS 123094]|uniref:SWIRM domain-containing protein n=1 Tax=Amniculicola lignicola CBS 123094 TaxID=1392246 RepID=A0A6A5WH42_9PLEO|nr:hypothetical protein P154DRAFT_575204 [Amniculicola lignicola CBS 123094]
MYSTFASTADTDALEDHPFLFAQTEDGILSESISHESVRLKAPSPHMVSMSGLNNFYGHFSESTPSSVHYGDTQELSEASAGNFSGREERDGSTSSGYMNGHERSFAPSPLNFAQSAQMSASTDAFTGGSGSARSASKTNANGVSKVPNGIIGLKATTASSRYQDLEINRKDLSGSPGAFSHNSKSSSTPEVSSARFRNSAKDYGKPPGFRANSSIPADMSWPEFARQCILAAENSRLNPFALHHEEYKLLREHITQAQVTTYLNIRNAILRLWTRNPLVYVTMEEAVGCVRDKRYFGLARVAYLWLMRNGYINFGCVAVPNMHDSVRSKIKTNPRRTILIIGAGMSGLGCARHLEGLFASQCTEQGEQPPKLIVLEARPRVGGRVYSHPLRNQSSSTLPNGHRCTAEMGAQIVTGYEHGNPMNAVIRGQLGIPYHGLRDNTILYDHDGTIVEKSRDILVEKLYNDVLERASVYRNKPAVFRTLEGDRNIMLFGRELADNGGATISELENSSAPLPADAKTTASVTEEKPSSGVEKLAGRAYQLSSGFDPNIPAAESVKNMGWPLRPNTNMSQSLDLDPIAKSSDYPTLGQTMDDGINQYQAIVDLKPKDLRLLNWHHANLEYANAVSVNQLSLSGWDQDIGNEFEGEHSEIVGGYQQVPRGLWQCPDKLDVRFKTIVKSIRYKTQSPGKGKAVKVECTNGEVFEADHIVLTTPLGVLKSGSITFEPSLPDWKQDVIERMGFGLLNKVILVYEKAFWEADRDMFGLLNEAEYQGSLEQRDYTSRRGRFYLFWNCIKTSGRPTLVALMAGDAAHYAEATPNDDLIKEVTGRLNKMFAPTPVPLPSETIITRWNKDPFARGSYSYVGPKTQTGDYDVMARPHGPIHFAGEATCGTHPATVHGAYLSGLRAASEVFEHITGPIKIPSPLVEKKVKIEQPPTPSGLAFKHRLEPQSVTQSPNARRLPDEDYEASIIGAILTEIGERPIKPGRAGVNPFLLFTKDYWHICKKECDDARRKATGDPNAKAAKQEVRLAVGLKWRTASVAVRKPYDDITQNARDNATANAATFKDRVAQWDSDATRIREVYIQAHPPPGGMESLMLSSHTAIELGGGKRLRRI